jgi:hypothetical protein
VNTHVEIGQIITELSDATVLKPRVFIPITTGILVYDTHSVRAVLKEPQLRARVAMNSLVDMTYSEPKIARNQDG